MSTKRVVRLSSLKVPGRCVHVFPSLCLSLKLRQVHVMGALPLRNLSRVWGYLNSFELPIWIRPYGIRLYASAFGCNLDEIEPSDLASYASLGDFFYRKLKPGVRPVDNAVLVSCGFHDFTDASLSSLLGQSSRRNRPSLWYHRQPTRGASQGDHLLPRCATRRRTVRPQ